VRVSTADEALQEISPSSWRSKSYITETSLRHEDLYSTRAFDADDMVDRPARSGDISRRTNTCVDVGLALGVMLV